MNILTVRNLTKNYGEFTAVDGVDFSIKKGEIFGFLGPNGAGKTTTINMLTGLARPTSGSVVLDGIDCVRNIKKAQRLIGIVPDESNLYDEMNGFDNLAFCASLYGMRKSPRRQRARELLEQFGLADTGRKLFKAYSRGMKRKLAIAAGIIHDPQILFLDEPTTGIDVESARHIRRLIADLNQKGTTIFLTTHYIEEAERLCHRIGFIVDGRIVKTGTVESLMADAQQDRVIEFKLEDDRTSLREALLKEFPGMAVHRVDEKTIRIRTEKAVNLTPLMRFFEKRSVPVFEARLIRPSLEDVFVRVTGIGLDKMKKEKEKEGKKA